MYHGNVMCSVEETAMQRRYITLCEEAGGDDGACAVLLVYCNGPRGILLVLDAWGGVRFFFVGLFFFFFLLCYISDAAATGKIVSCNGEIAAVQCRFVADHILLGTSSWFLLSSTGRPVATLTWSLYRAVPLAPRPSRSNKHLREASKVMCPAATCIHPYVCMYHVYACSMFHVHAAFVHSFI
ncbi:unnamed protein product [Periconia digitata]|uniref:Uncharacterized protein n=1 Tax=Periconia digitata TaxID=1303443 RepID=A0A9W4UTM3_9PLEO|nr:unnamed protein product [Periconia digitata]